MKAIKTLVLLLALGLSAYGQGVVVTANKLKGSDTAPSGTCGAQRIELTTAGVVWVCASGTWTSSGGGGGTTINSTDGFFPYRSSATAFSNSPMSRVDASTVQVLAINGGSAANDDITIQGTSNATRTTSYLNLQPNGGLVGIATATPTARLEIKGVGTSTGKTLRLIDSAGAETFVIQDNGAGCISNGSACLTGIDSSTRLKITGGDLWFAGTSKLVLGGATGSAITRYGSIFGDAGQANITYRTYSDHYFETDTGDNTAGTNRLTIKGSTGRVGIGINAPTAQLDLRPVSNSTVGQVIRLASGQTANALQIENSTGTVLSSVDANGLWRDSGTAQTLTGAGAVNLTTYTTLVVTTGANALTLAAGSEGQTKFIRMSTDAGDGTLTVTNGQGFTTLTFNDAGDFVLLFYRDSKWHILTNSGCAVA